jgi:rfaE bifunctional protein kinase chain/domain
LRGFEVDKLKMLFDNFLGKRIAVIGDLMLDKYIWGSVSRISPEAPVPVLEVESESARLGGAANVANNIKSLGAEPILFGIVGDDEAGETISRILGDMSLRREGVMKVSDRPTTVKTRVIAHNQHVVRMDHEMRKDVDEKLVARVIDILGSMSDEIDGLIFEDYNKGMLTKELLSGVIRFANKNDTVVSVDPKQNNFFEYKHVTVFKPNRKEAENALRMPIGSDEEALAAAKELLADLHCQNVLLTRGEKGMTLVAKDGTYAHFPTKARKVADVSGAGDTVISTFTVALVSGATVTEAAAIANHAGGIVCGEVGIAPVDREKLFAEVANDSKSISEGTSWGEFR